jgi:magnesium-transporting ATPase (P-type)
MFDYESPKEKEPVDYTGLKIVAILAPVFFLITFLSNADMGLTVCIILGMIMLAVKIRWYLRKHIWFWAIIAVILALHVPLVFMVQWPKNAPTLFYTMPIGIADFLIISGALGLAENLMSNGSPPNDENE